MNAMLDYSERTASLLTHIPLPVKNAFMEYLARIWAPFRSGHTGFPESRLPFWDQFLPLLDRKFGGHPKPEGNPGGFLAQIRWAQFCFFVCIRIQDDFYDHQLENRSFVVLGNDFLLEVESFLGDYFPRNNHIHAIYPQLLRQTSHNIYRTVTLQEQYDPSPRDLLECYAGVGAIFHLGPSVLCMRYGKQEYAAPLRDLYSHLVVVCQILDDLTDISEDLRQGKVNFAAAVLLSSYSDGERSRDDALENIGRNIIRCGVGSVFEEVYQNLSAAAAIAADLDLTEIHEYVGRYRAGVRLLEAQHHKARVDTIFRPTAPPE